MASHVFLHITPIAPDEQPIVAAIPRAIVDCFNIRLRMSDRTAIEVTPQAAESLLYASDGVGAGCYTLKGCEGSVEGSRRDLAQDRLVALARSLGFGLGELPIEIDPTIKIDI